MMTLSDLNLECQYHQKAPQTTINTPIVIGVDEVGRGSLFGHMTVAAVILPHELTGEFSNLNLIGTPLQELNDSKKLSETKRNKLFDIIQAISISHVIVDVPVSIIDSINIYQATLLGMQLAIERLITINTLTPTMLEVVIDGNAMPILSKAYQQYQPCLRTLIKGDGKHTSIACASILAKVHRDQSMTAYANRYPNYQLHKNKGYASATHRHAIMTHGVLPEHRKSFEPMRSLLKQPPLFQDSSS